MHTIDRTLSAVALACATLPAVAASPATARAAQLLSALRHAYPGTHFSRVSPTPIPDLYEVWMGANMALVSPRSLRYLVFGQVFDTRTMTDLSAPKLAAARQDHDTPSAAPRLPIARLPLADAIKTVQGNGRRTLAVFSDPGCPYCRQLAPELDKLHDVTIYTFLLPFHGEALPAAIWCAADRQRAWHRYMVEGDRHLDAIASNASALCPHPLERNLALAQRLAVQGTPTLIYADGSRTDGYADAAEIESHLVETASTAPNATTAREDSR